MIGVCVFCVLFVCFVSVGSWFSWIICLLFSQLIPVCASGRELPIYCMWKPPAGNSGLQVRFPSQILHPVEMADGRCKMIDKYRITLRKIGGTAGLCSETAPPGARRTMASGGRGTDQAALSLDNQVHIRKSERKQLVWSTQIRRKGLTASRNSGGIYG